MSNNSIRIRFEDEDDPGYEVARYLAAARMESRLALAVGGVLFFSTLALVVFFAL